MSFQCDVPAVPTLQQDDDIVRITRWDFAPGAATGWHSHGWPYFVVLLTEAVLRIHDGEKRPTFLWSQGKATCAPLALRTML